MKFLFELLFFLVAVHKRRCREGDDQSIESVAYGYSVGLWLLGTLGRTRHGQ